MSLIAFVIERRLLKALKTGSVETAPRTAAGAATSDASGAATGATGGARPGAGEPRGELTTAPDQVHDQPRG
jgi:hypothetical protein